MRLLRIWLSIGTQSFGGGTATFTLIRRAAVERHRWMTDDEFTRMWTLCQMSPGINLLCLTVLIGKRVAGPKGIAAALIGLLLPTVALTIVATAFYTRIHRLASVRAALQGVIPATVGLGLMTSLDLARPLLAAARREGRQSLALAAILLAGSGFVVARWRLPVVFVLCGAGTVAAMAQWRRDAMSRRSDAEGQ